MLFGGLLKPDIQGLMERKDISGLAKGLKHRDIDVKRPSAIALGDMGDVRAVDHLIACLDDVAIFEEVAQALAKLGDQRAVTPLIKYFIKGPNPELAAQALDILGWGPRDDNVDRMRAIYYIRNRLWNGFKDVCATGIGPLISCIRDPRVCGDDRTMAITALSYINDKRAVLPFIRLLTDNEPGLRMSAAIALGEIGDARAVEPLSRCMDDSSRDVKCCATIALYRLEPSKNIKAILPLLKDKDPAIRRKAILALQASEDPSSVTVLVSCIGDRSYRETHRMAAMTLIKKHKEGSINNNVWGDVLRTCDVIRPALADGEYDVIM